MKKFLLTLISSLLYVNTAFSQWGDYEYVPLLQEGKVWILEPEKYLYQDFPYMMRVTLKDDTIVDDKKAKIVSVQEMYPDRDVTYQITLLEENKCIFVHSSDNTWNPLLDFNPHVGQRTIDRIENGEVLSGLYIKEEGYFNFYETYRYIKTQANDYWIEGIGSTEMDYLTHFSSEMPISSAPIEPRLCKCFHNNSLIFDREEFEYISGIAENVLPLRPPSHTYDLHGREITNPQSGSIYIRDGKKFVAK